MNLQKVLNMYPQTQIASSGAGSPGMETTYFGNATRAAVNKFQALHLAELGITAPTGNVFAGTRGLLNQVCTTSTSNNTNTNTTTTTTSGPVNAMLASSQPTGMLVAGQAGARLAEVTFTGNGTVTAIELQRTGVSADATLANVYLYDGNIRITDAASVVTGGYIRFNAGSGLFTVNGTRTLTVRADIASGTSGQSVGVKLNSLTANGAVSTYTNVMGNMLQIGSATPATVNFSTITTTNTTVDAGTQNYKLWEGSASVGTRDVTLKAATFKFVGSAPVDAVANVSLYVDGTKVAGPSMINAANNNKLSFDLMTGYLLRTGSHTIEVRGDIVKGSNRTMTFSIENVADLMLEDTSLYGVNVSPTVANSAMTQSNSTYRTITVNSGSVTVNVDPAFVANKVTGGATNVPVAQFTMKAYGEDVKVTSLNVTPSLSSAAPYAGGLPNVSLYVNGGQVGTSQNWTSGALTYNLGSSLIIPAGQTVTLTVKADIVNATSSSSYTGGTVSVQISGSSNGQGMSSNEIVSVASSAVTGNSLTISSGAGSFARTSGFTAVSVAPNSTNVKIGSFTLQADSSEDIRVTTLGVNPAVSTYTITNISNLTVKSNGVTVGTPVGNPASGTSTFSFSDIVVPANSTRTFEVYADVGGASSGSVTADMQITYRGVVSNTTTTSSAAGVAITSAASTLAAPSLVSSSPVAQYVVGGSTFGIATFKLGTGSVGTTANVRELRFTTNGTDAIESITVGGVTAPVISGGTTTVSGLNIAVSYTGTDVPVTVKFSGFQNSTSGGSLQNSVTNVWVRLGHIEATSGSGSVITNTTVATSSAMVLVASKPVVTTGAGNADTLVLGAENKVGEFTVSADANGKVSVATTSLSLSAIGVTGVEFTSPRIADGNTTISGSTVTGSSTMVAVFSPAYEISAGQSKTFSVYAVVSGAAQSGITPYVTSRLTSGATFVWRDVIGGNTELTGASIYNFPTSSFTTKR
jgi:DNA-binding protein YbaB